MFPAGDDVVVVVPGIPVVKSLMGILCGKQVRNTDSFWTFTFFDAVAAGRTGDQIQAPEDLQDCLP